MFAKRQTTMPHQSSKFFFCMDKDSRVHNAMVIDIKMSFISNLGSATPETKCNPRMLKITVFCHKQTVILRILMGQL